MSSAALERQIRPIYDALDTNSNKSAIVSCNKLLKKYPKLDLVKALKALALVRMQKVEESLALCDEVLASKPTDDGILTAMMHVLRGLGRHTDLVKMWEDAFKQQPTNEEYGCQTFFANTRIGNWKGAQQIATKLQKVFHDERYIYWNAISAVMQAKDMATPASMRTLLYKLAHRVLPQEPSLTQAPADRLHLHLAILKELEMWDDAQKLLTSPIGEALCSASLIVEEQRRDIARLSGRWKEEGERAQDKILNKGSRNWLEYVSILDAAFAPVASPQAKAASTASSEEARTECSENISHARDFLLRISEQDGASDRSALIALMELEKRGREHGFSEGSTELFRLMESYFHRVGDKACCFEDMKPYLILEGDERAQWISFLESVDVPCDSLVHLRRLINVHKLLRHGLDAGELDAESEAERGAGYLALYHEGLQFGVDLPDTELQPADDFAILAAHAYVSVWALGGGEAALYQAVTILEYALTKSKQAFQMRIMLIRIYQLLAAPSLAIEHYRALNVKQVQTDTLSYLILSRASTFSLGATGDLTMLSEAVETNQIYINNSQDTADWIIRAFTNEKYSQVPEFVELEERLEHSLQRDLIKVENVRMQIAHETVNKDIIDMFLIDLKFNFDRFHHDNRDFEIVPNYQPACKETFAEQTRLFNQNGFDWLWIFLKIYIRALMQGSDLDEIVEDKLLIGDRPRQSNDPDNKIPLRERLVQKRDGEESQLTPDESALYHYAMDLADWLGPHHDYVRPPPEEVLAEASRLTEIKTGFPLRGVDISAKNGGAANGHTKKEEDAPPVKDAPASAGEFYDGMQARFRDAVQRHALTDACHVATLTQEALILLSVETVRFKPPHIVKMHKLGNLVQSIKDIRAKAIAVMKEMAAELQRISEEEGTSEKRKAFVEACKPIQSSAIDHDYVLGIAKKVTDARKKVLDGIGKGVAKLSNTHGQ